MENQNYYDDILFLINKGKLLEATKYIKNISGIGLKEAKDCVDSLLEVKKQRMLTTEDISNCLRKNYIDLDKIAPKNSASAQWGLRNIKDINNIIPYSTLHLDYNMVFFNFLYNNFCDCEIESFVPVKKLFPHAPEYAMPINFMLTKDGKRVVVLIVEGGEKFKRYSVLETMELCKENNITALRFFTTYPNNEKYVAERIRKYLD